MVILGELDKNILPSLEIIRQELISKVSDHGKTTHEYEYDQCQEIKNAISDIKYGKIYDTICSAYPNRHVETVDPMNELYISAIGGPGSDRVFETPHLDGPFWFLFGCTVLRCVFAIQGNQSIVTEFPSENVSVALKTGQFVAFDYNRDVHYIRQESGEMCDDDRMVLKLHYIVVSKYTPKIWIKMCKLMNSKYNDFMRFLFLRSQRVDQRMDAKILASFINFFTVFYMHCFLLMVKLRKAL